MKIKNMSRLVFISLLFLFLINTLAFANYPVTALWCKRSGDNIKISIKVEGPVIVNHFTLDDPPRIVVDLQGAENKIKNLPLKKLTFTSMGALKAIRTGQVNENTVRIVADLSKMVDYKVEKQNGFIIVWLKYVPEEKIPTPKPIVTPKVFLGKSTPTPLPRLTPLIVKRPTPTPTPIPSIYDQFRNIPPVTLEFYRTDIHEILRALARIAKMNIVIDESVEGTISLYLKKVKFPEALKLVAELGNLEFAKEGNILIVARKGMLSEAFSKVKIKSVPLKYLKPDEAKATLEAVLPKDKKVTIIPDKNARALILRGPESEIAKIIPLIKNMDSKVRTKTFKLENAITKEEAQAIVKMLSIVIPPENIELDERQNMIIVKGSEEELKNAESLIKNLDKKLPQVMIEVKVVAVSTDATRDLGIEWEQIFAGGIRFGEISLGGTFERLTKLNITLRTMVQHKKAEVLANPKVMTLDGYEATINLADEVPVGESISVDEATGIRTVTPTFKKVGVILRVVPRVNKDRSSLLLELHPEISTITDWLDTEGLIVKKIPVIGTRKIDTFVRLKNNEPLVIGGLIKSEDVKELRKVPILGDLPLLGGLFRFVKKTHTESEVIIIIVPHIISY